MGGGAGGPLLAPILSVRIRIHPIYRPTVASRFVHFGCEQVWMFSFVEISKFSKLFILVLVIGRKCIFDQF